ncbi:YpmS family protein [Halalkalibacter alkalisediminis]|uniref:YpmS family protein n=1 Tax=Halalkalibacter alkalisediminis TaxID=935616 RepID=A0ABV6NLZ2_9BACI|nr:YpmS family protein [Halalkalibacter alkalisediminis]
MRKNANKWKIAFFTLSGLVLLLVITVVLLFYKHFPEVSEDHFIQQSPSMDEATFTIQTNKGRLNSLIASRIEQTPSEISYMVELQEDKVQFRSAFRVLGQEIPVTVNFLPEVVANGDLLLKVETFSLGLLSLPVEQVLQLISGWIDFADWVVTYPVDRLVEIKVTEIRVNEKDTMHFRFTRFDLEQDIIELEMIVE